MTDDFDENPTTTDDQPPLELHNTITAQSFGAVSVQDAHSLPMSSKPAEEQDPDAHVNSTPEEIAKVQITHPGVKKLPLPKGAHPQTQPGLTLNI
jgi:hypothetical protein